MVMENGIAASAFCSQHHIDVAFIYSLQNHGLIEATTTGQELFLHASQVPEIKRLMHLHYDLHINLEGIDAVTQLLKRIEKLQEEMGRLKHRLRLYEGTSQSTVPS